MVELSDDDDGTLPDPAAALSSARAASSKAATKPAASRGVKTHNRGHDAFVACRLMGDDCMLARGHRGDCISKSVSKSIELQGGVLKGGPGSPSALPKPSRQASKEATKAAGSGAASSAVSPSQPAAASTKAAAPSASAAPAAALPAAERQPSDAGPSGGAKPKKGSRVACGKCAGCLFEASNRYCGKCKSCQTEEKEAAKPGAKPKTREQRIAKCDECICHENHSGRGNMFMRTKQEVLAATEYTKALALEKYQAKTKDRALVLRNRSFCYCQMKQLDEALADAEEAISIEPQKIENHWRKVNALKERAREAAGQRTEYACLQELQQAALKATAEVPFEEQNKVRRRALPHGSLGE